MEAKQKALKRILAGTDFSRPASHAVVRAALLATEHSARLEIVHVTPRLDRKALKGLDVDRSFCTGTDPVIEQHLEETRALVRKHGVTATIKLLKGGAAATLAGEAMRLSADLVVVGCRGERSFKDALIGTTAERVLERWTGDTLVVKDSPKGAYGTILACVALAPVSCSVVMSAVALSEQARLQILHAYEPMFEMKLISHNATGETIANHRAAAKGEAVRGLTELLDRCPVPSDRCLERHVLHGAPSTLIPGAAVRYGADVIVVGKNQSVLEAFFLGSVTKKIVRAARMDVLVSGSR